MTPEKILEEMGYIAFEVFHPLLPQRWEAVVAIRKTHGQFMNLSRRKRTDFMDGVRPHFTTRQEAETYGYECIRRLIAKDYFKKQ